MRPHRLPPSWIISAGEYLAGNTPNPCVVCNRDIKFGLFLKKASELGAERIATGHYVRKAAEGGRTWLGRAREMNSQEYFLGMLSQEAIRLSVFPLHDTTKEEARNLAASAHVAIHKRDTSQDVCFIGPGGMSRSFPPVPVITHAPEIFWIREDW